MEFKEDQELFWIHGECHIVAKVLKVEAERVYISGITKNYWIKKKTLINKINKAYPTNISNNW